MFGSFCWHIIRWKGFSRGESGYLICALVNLRILAIALKQTWYTVSTNPLLKPSECFYLPCLFFFNGPFTHSGHRPYHNPNSAMSRLKSIPLNDFGSILLATAPRQLKAIISFFVTLNDKSTQMKVKHWSENLFKKSSKWWLFQKLHQKSSKVKLN